MKYKSEIPDKSSSHGKGSFKKFRTRLGRYLHHSRAKQKSPAQKAVVSEILK